jgi:AcrR family transcriptional regulator
MPSARAPTERRTRNARERIVDVAERLFAEQGYQAVSLRTIMGIARVNVAAAHYHFGSKKNLLQAVFDRRVAQINVARRQRLRTCVDAAGRAVCVEKVLEAYVAPALEICSDPGGQLFVRVAALTSVDPDPEVQDIINTAYGDTGRLFVKALKRACPTVGNADLYWRLQCVYGAMMYLRANNGRVARILGRDPVPIDSRTIKQALRHVIPFLAAGLSAPAPARRRLARRKSPT